MPVPTRRPVRKLTTLALLTSSAVVLNVLEGTIPFFSGVVGGKVGLANVVTMFVFLTVSWREALLVGAVRSVLGALLGGNPMAIAYSLAGTLCSVGGMRVAKKAFGARIGAIGLSILGAVCYNLGQIATAWAILRSTAVLAYLPPLTMLSAFAGVLTGAAAEAIAGVMRQ